MFTRGHRAVCERRGRGIACPPVEAYAIALSLAKGNGHGVEKLSGGSQRQLPLAQLSRRLAAVDHRYVKA
jgi:hypothetical protein